jgi:hypothetical protein
LCARAHGGNLRAMRSTTLIAAALLACVPCAALAQDAARQTAELTLTEQRPARSTGARLAIDYVNTSDPAAKPPAVQRTMITLAPGSRIDTSVPGQCTAPNPQLMASGSSACPAESRVGGGEITLDTGVPGPARILENDVTLLNNRDELIFVLESKSEPRSRIVARAVIGEGTITTDVTGVPGGPPDGFVAIRRVRLALDSLPGYLTTPPTCPANRVWTYSVAFTYRDGVTQTVDGSAPCTGPAERPPDCRRPAKMRFGLHRREGTRVVQAVAYVNGRRSASRSGRDVRSVALAALPTAGRLSIRIVATHSTGAKVVSTRSWNGCTKTGPRTRVIRPS